MTDQTPAPQPGPIITPTIARLYGRHATELAELNKRHAAERAAEGMPPAPATRTRPAEIKRGGGDRRSNYPANPAHVWGEFALLAIEMGGYGDLTAIDPYTKDRLWIGEVFGGSEVTTAQALRILADEMERVGFLPGEGADVPVQDQQVDGQLPYGTDLNADDALDREVDDLLGRPARGDLG